MSERHPHLERPIRRRIGDTLPPMMLDDDFIQRFCDGLDQVLAPVPAALDNFHAYLDPHLAPDDFLDWLAAWVAIDLDANLPLADRRRLVSRAAILYHRRGTAACLAEMIELSTGARPTITEGGAVSWSPTPEGKLPGTAGQTMVITLPMKEPSKAAVARLEALIVANKPAHVPHRLEFVAPAKPLAPPKKLPPPPIQQDPGDGSVPVKEGSS